MATNRTEARPDESLGSLIMALQDQVWNLVEDTNHPERKAELIRLYDDLYDAAIELIDANVARETAKYKQAATGLRSATKSIEKALAGMEAVAKTIKLIGDAVEAVSKVL